MCAIFLSDFHLPFSPADDKAPIFFIAKRTHTYLCDQIMREFTFSYCPRKVNCHQLCSSGFRVKMFSFIRANKRKFGRPWHCNRCNCDSRRRSGMNLKAPSRNAINRAVDWRSFSVVSLRYCWNVSFGYICRSFILFFAANRHIKDDG